MGSTRNQIDHTLKNRRQHSNILNVRAFKGAGCDTDHCLVVDKVRERVVVINTQHRNLMWKALISGR